MASATKHEIVRMIRDAFTGVIVYALFLDGLNGSNV
jgi:hypothetical protein